MNAKEAHKLSNDEVAIELTRLRRKQFDLRSQKVTDKIEDVSQFRKVRRDVARLLTVQNQRARAGSTQ